MKYCSACDQSKPCSDFGANRSKKDGLQATCKSCRSTYQRKWYKANKRVHMARVTDYVQRRRRAHYEWLMQYAAAKGCAVCGEKDPLVLEFDHRHASKKVGSVSNMVQQGVSRAKIKAEVAKCDVLCANCHRRKTHMERNSLPYQISCGVEQR